MSQSPATEAEFYGADGTLYTLRVRTYDLSGQPDTYWVTSQQISVSAETSYYHFDGQVVAMSRGEEIAYLAQDQLGSTGLVVSSSGEVLSEVRYYPYGEIRSSGMELATDKTFTGQRAEDFGLLDYNARYYDPRLGRFASADTMIPDPGNPLAWDRYGYVLYNPVKYVDPTGHYFCEDTASCQHNTYHTYIAGQLSDEVLKEYNVTLKGSGWTDTNKYNAALGVTSTGRAFTDNYNESASASFMEVYEYMVFEWNTECYGCRSEAQNAICADFSSEVCRASGAVTLGGHNIMFASMSRNPRYGANHVVHELGHAISPALSGRPYEVMSEALQDPNSLLHRPNTSAKNGFASSGFPWQQAVVNVDQYYEIWADQFLGWVFNTWESSPIGQARSDWMITQMSMFLP